MDVDRLERFGNRLNDLDWGWWPFLFLRPQQEEPMGSRRVALISLFVGPVYGFMLCTIYLLAGLPLDPLNFALMILATSLLFFLLYRFTLAWCWNRRARRLRREGIGGI